MTWKTYKPHILISILAFLAIVVMCLFVSLPVNSDTEIFERQKVETKSRVDNNVIQAGDTIASLQEELAHVKKQIRSISRVQVANMTRLEEELEERILHGVDPTKSSHSTFDSEKERRQEEERIRSEEARITSFDRQLETEPYDKDWAPDAEKKIVETFSPDRFQGSVIGGVNCSSSLCRVIIHHEDDRSYNEFTEGFVKSVPWSSQGWAKGSSADDGDGVAKTLIYISREGTPLPKMAQEE